MKYTVVFNSKPAVCLDILDRLEAGNPAIHHVLVACRRYGLGATLYQAGRVYAQVTTRGSLAF